MVDILNQPGNPFRPAADSIWQCPCGFEGIYKKVVGHRKGYKRRPECTGKIIPINPPYSPIQKLKELANQQAAVQATAGVEATPDEVRAVSPPPAPKRPVFEYKPDVVERTALDDPEELARQFNLSSKALIDDAFGGDNGAGGGIGGSGLPPGDWKLETPPELPAPSQARETVSLPIIVRVMYDWAKAEGWHKGDGSLSAFVTDCLLDTFNNVWDKAVVVVDRQEVLGG